MNSKDIQTNRKRKLNESNDNNEKKSRTESNGRTPLRESDQWVDKHRPKNTKQIIGQQGEKSCVNKLIKWLANWHKNLDQKPGFGKFASDDGSGYRAALLSGQPGVGKTTTAQLVCKELGYDFIELNASDARSKKTLENEIKELLKNTTLASYFGTKSSVTSKHVVIMDEVDGMAGTEDRGGIAELILLIKSTKVPLICICNDRSHPKIRSLVNYCFDLRFYRPRIEQIKGPMMSIAYKEGVQIPPNVLHELIMSSNNDIRQVLHNLSLLSIGAKRIDNLMSEQSIKDVKLGPFDAVRKVFSAGEEYARMSFQDKSDLFFCDYSIMPLFNFENYLHVNPHKAKSEVQKLKLAMKSIEAMAFGDLIEKQIRSTNNWSLLPLEAAYASVMPGSYMNGQLGGMIAFPSFMGRLSTTNKRNRLLQELKMHMNLKISGSKSALNLDYLEPLRDAIIEPLVANGTGGVPTSIEKLENYCLRREDIESITELTLWKDQKDPMSRVDSKVKAALTRAYNKEGFCLPYSLGTISKGKKGKSSADMDDLNEGEEGLDDDVTAEEEDDDIAGDAMIKAKKKTAKKVTEKETKVKTKSKKNETQKETKKKTKKKTDIESDSESKTTEKVDTKEIKTKPKKTDIDSESKTAQKVDTKEPKRKPKKRIVIDSDSDSEPQIEKVVKKETKSETKNGSEVTPKKSSKAVSKSNESVPLRQSPRKSTPIKEVENRSKPQTELRTSPRKAPKIEPNVSPKKKITESKNDSKKKSKNEVKTPAKSEESTDKKSKSETKSKPPKKTPENSKKEPKNDSNSGSKGKQLTINSFFKKK